MSLRASFFLAALLFLTPFGASAQALPSCSMTVAPATINKGGSVTLKWASANATSAYIPGPGLGAVPVNGQKNLIPTGSTKWVGTFTGPGGKTTCQAIVVVLNDGSPMTVIDSGDYAVDAPASGSVSGGGSVGSGGSVQNPGNAGSTGSVGAPGTVGNTGTVMVDDSSYVDGPGSVSGPGAVSDPGKLNGTSQLNPAPTLPRSNNEPQLTSGANTGLVPCTGINCEACDLAKLSQRIVNFLIGLSIPLAAVLFAWAGVLYFSSSVVNKLEKARKIFTSVLIGFGIAVGSWLIVQTFLSAILSNDYKSWNTIQCVGSQRKTTATVEDLLGSINVLNGLNTSPDARLQGPAVVQTAPSSVYGCPNGWEYVSDYAQCINPNDRSQVVDATRIGTVNAAYSGDINAAATGYYGADTSAGPDGGNKACAWAVNNVLNSAGIPSIDGNSVEGMEQALLSGRGIYVDTSTAQAGDIIVWKQGTVSHVGICQTNGCTSALSNSSSQASFTNVSGSTLLGVPGRVYRVTK